VVAAPDALAFIAPVHFCSFPAILKGWIDRVFTHGFAFGLTSAGWHGNVNGWLPLLHHQRALIMTSTIFDQDAYDNGIRDAVGKVIDDWAFQYPGIEDVERVYFYGATAASPETIQRYLEHAYELSTGFGTPARQERFFARRSGPRTHSNACTRRSNDAPTSPESSMNKIHDQPTEPILPDELTAVQFASRQPDQPRRASPCDVELHHPAGRDLSSF